MKPAERKKFVNSILNNVDAYNDMYKVLSKKSIMYKGIIKNIATALFADHKSSPFGTNAKSSEIINY